MLFHLGRYVLMMIGVFRKPEKYSMYWKETMREMTSIGFGSIGIVCIISVFLGGVTAVQTAYQLISGLVPLEVIGQITRDSTILELAPTILLLVLAGNVGSQIASQIGTMRVTEQIDALEIMGVNSKGYLILPKIIASFCIIPLLVVIGMSVSITGGYVASTLSGTISHQQFVDGLRRDWDPYLVTVGITKTFVFSFIMSSISAYQGYYTTGGALEVGTSSTRAVVYSCIMILLADFVVAQILF